MSSKLEAWLENTKQEVGDYELELKQAIAAIEKLKAALEFYLVYPPLMKEAETALAIDPEKL